MLTLRRTRQPQLSLLGQPSLTTGPSVRTSVAIWSLATMLSLISGSATAQQAATGPQDGEASSNRWFQIEVILFTHRNLQTEEIWRDDLALSYPDNWVLLKDPNNPQPTTLTVEPGAPLTADSETNRDTAPTTDNPTPPEPKPVNLATDAFYMLPKEARLLNKQAQELAWSKAYDLVYHEAWRQPVESQELAPAVLIAAGETYGDHRQIEGSLSVSVARYLHINSNLWMADFIPNNAQEPEFSPLPARPKPQSPIEPTQEPAVSVINVTQSLNPTAAPDTAQTPAVLPTDTLANIETAPAFLPRNIAVLKQKRRMRSGEIHYIDHPRIGMLVLVTPYDPSIEAGGNGELQ